MFQNGVTPGSPGRTGTAVSANAWAANAAAAGAGDEEAIAVRTDEVEALLAAGRLPPGEVVVQLCRGIAAFGAGVLVSALVGSVVDAPESSAESVVAGSVLLSVSFDGVSAAVSSAVEVSDVEESESPPHAASVRAAMTAVASSGLFFMVGCSPGSW